MSLARLVMVLLTLAVAIRCFAADEPYPNDIKAQYAAYLKAQEKAFQSSAKADLDAAAKYQAAVKRLQEDGMRLYADEATAFKVYKELQDRLDKLPRQSVERKMVEAKMRVAVRELTPPKRHG